VSTKVITLISLDFISNIEPVNFFEILSVPLSKSRQFIISLTFLRLQAGVCVLRDLLLMFDSLNVDVAVGDESPLPVQFCVQLGILSLTIVVDGALFIDLRSQRLDETNVSVDT
jgi:hypothetical protein